MLAVPRLEGAEGVELAERAEEREERAEDGEPRLRAAVGVGRARVGDGGRYRGDYRMAHGPC